MRHSIFQYICVSVVTALCLQATLGWAQTSTESSSSNSTASQPPEKPTYNSATERDNALLASAKPDEIVWLDTPNGKVLGLLKQGEQKENKGAVLILHAPELSQRWPASLDNLRRNLPLYGWTTLAVSLPARYSNIAPTRDEQTSTSSASDPTSAAADSATPAVASPSTPTEAIPLKSRAQIIEERVEAALSHLRTDGASSLVIVVDNSGAPDALAAPLKKIPDGATPKELEDGPLQSLVIVNLQGEEPLTKNQLTSLFSAPALPVMDVFFNPDNSFQKEMRRLHRAEAMRQKLDDYQQVVLPPEAVASISNNKNFWLEKVRGFIEKKSERTRSPKGPTNSINTGKTN